MQTDLYSRSPLPPVLVLETSHADGVTDHEIPIEVQCRCKECVELYLHSPSPILFNDFMFNHLKPRGYFMYARLRLQCDATRAETRFRLSAKRTSPFKSVGDFSRLLAAELCASAVVMLDTPCSEVV